MGIIYKATNKLNGKEYVGKTIFTLEWRRAEHEAKASNGSTLYFHRAIRKYGPHNFTWSILAEDEDHEWLLFMECCFIKRMKTLMPKGYNMTPGGVGHEYSGQDKVTISERTKEALARPDIRVKITGRVSPMKGRTHSDASKRKTSEALKGRARSPKTCVKISVALKGRIISPEARANMRKARLGKKHSEETKEKIRQSRIGKKLTEEHKEALRQGWALKKQKEKSDV